jgi:hypothetical protein
VGRCELTTKTKNNDESMFQATQKQLASYLTVGLGAGCLAVTADAAIVTFTGSGSFVEGAAAGDDMPTTSLTLPDTSVLDIDSDSHSSHLFFWLGPAGRFTGTGTSGVGPYPLNYPGISLLGRGDGIFANDASYYPNLGGLVIGGTPQADFVGDVSGYIGFITEFGNKGWLKVAFNSTTGQFSYDGGAVATAGEELTAGEIAAVPEPASVLGTLGLLSAGMFVRRRRLAA